MAPFFAKLFPFLKVIMYDTLVICDFSYFRHFALKRLLYADFLKGICCMPQIVLATNDLFKGLNSLNFC